MLTQSELSADVFPWAVTAALKNSGPKLLWSLAHLAVLCTCLAQGSMAAPGRGRLVVNPKSGSLCCSMDTVLGFVNRWQMLRCTCKSEMVMLWKHRATPGLVLRRE